MLDSELIASGPRGLRRSFSSSTMKHTFLVMMFAAAPLLAQGGAKTRTELANAIAIEEQERDLAKAEKAYRAAIDDAKLSELARDLANERLGQLLKRLGRDAEAKPYLERGAPQGTIATLDDVTNVLQDAERTKALREKARELVQQKLANPSGGSQPLEQLMWVGEPAIPEIAAALTGKSVHVNTVDGQALASLAGLLWYFGTPSAESHLEQLLRGGDAALRQCLVANASQLRDSRMLRFAERWLQQEKDEDVAMQLLANEQGNRPLAIDSDVLIDDAARRSPRVQVWVLLSMENRETSRTALAKAHAIARNFLGGADPELGQAAERFLGTWMSQSSPEGVELLLQQLPHIRNGTVDLAVGNDLPDEWLLPKPPNASLAPMRPEAAARLWPRLVACATAMRPESRNWTWLSNRIYWCESALGPEIVPDVLSLIEANKGETSWLRGKVNVANAASVLRTYDAIHEAGTRSDLLALLGPVELTPELFEPLQQRAAATIAADAKDTGFRFAMPIARTGNAAAADWLVAYYRRLPAEGTWTAEALVKLAGRTLDERVRAAVRAVVGMPNLEPASRSELVLVLLAKDGAQALDLVVETIGNTGPTQHPLARAAKPTPITPLQYVVLPEPDPPHGIADMEVAGILPALAKRLAARNVSTPTLDAYRATNRILTAGAEAGLATARGVSQGVRTSVSWLEVLVQRLQWEDPPGELHAWLDDALRTRSKVLFGVIEKLNDKEVARIRPQLDALLSGDDEGLAELAFDNLLRTLQSMDFDALMKSKHERIRDKAFWFALERGQLSNEAAIAAIGKGRGNDRIAQYLGSRVAVEAVPALIGLLKDPIEGVRTSAAEALTKIRFHHEQQAYWDRIVKGLDASPASAAEKLLLQAKPGASKQQRVLAITSLGTLGVPEALPFLIEWTQDPDADIAKKANDAITQIHLNPRK